MFEQYKLENGVRVLHIPLSSTQSVTTLVMYPVGSRYEPEPLRGVSHYVEHIMFKGTKKRPSPLDLAREIDRLGAEYNAFTGKEYTGYYIKADVDHFERSADVLSDMLFDSLYNAEEMEREKTVIVEEIKMYHDNPLMNIDNVFEEVLYDGSPLGHDIAGTKEHVLAYKRDEVIAYRDKYYQPENMTVVIAGNINGEMKELVKHYFGSRSSEKSSSDFKPFALGSEDKASRVKVEHKNTKQAQLMLGFPAFKYTERKEQITLGVLNTILGGSMSSRLFMEIREKRGLAYMVRSGSDNYRDTGYAYVRVGLDAKNVNEAINVVGEEVQKMVATTVTDTELEDAKTRIRGLLALSMEDSSNIANWYVKQAVFMDDIQSPLQYLDKIDSVTKDDLKQIAEKVFVPDAMRVALIGDMQQDKIMF